VPGLAERPVGVGVIGAGYWGPNVIRNLAENPRAEVRVIADVRPERLDQVRPRWPGARTTEDPLELIGDDAVEAIAITTPVSTHFELARAALAAGKHVLVAKPLTATVAEADALVELASESGRVVMVDHTFVYTAAVRKIHELIASGALGDLYYIDSVRVNLGLFQHDVNVIWDLAAHDFAIVLHLLGGRSPRSVSATGASHSASGLADVAYVTLQFDDALIAHCHLNWLSPVKIRQTLIGGSERMLVWDDLAPDEKVKVYDRGIRALEQAGDEKVYKALVDYRIGDVWTPQLDRREALAAEVDHVLDCVTLGERPLTGAPEGREVVRLLEAATASLHDDGRAQHLAEWVGS
jgi:predicted dehydrogenase